MASISDLLRDIVNGDPIATETLEALVARIDEAAPPLRDVLARAARGRPLSDNDATLFFYGLHILAAGRDRPSFPALLQFLRRPEDDVDDLLGDALTESLPRVAAGLFDGDVDALLAAAVDTRLCDVARDALIRAATFLTWDGRIPLERMHVFLAGFEQTPPPDEDMAWYAWSQAITLLGLRDLLPRLQTVFNSDRFPEDIVEWRHIEQELRDAERAPTDVERFTAASLGYADDVVETLRWTERGDDEPDQREQPFVNPHRDVGRNDSCPCGSGKKYKKCCLGNA